MHYNEAMKPEIARRLLDLNRQFYQTFAGEFSATRQRLQPGVKRLLETLSGDETVLDLGCGNGEMLQVLLRRGHRAALLGVDFSPSLMAVAHVPGQSTTLSLLCVDLGDPGWEDLVRAAMPQPFDLVTAFASLHHLPGSDRRLGFLQAVHALLCPRGRFFHSEWQFLNSERLSQRVQPWQKAGLSTTDVEPGDHLLDWRRGGRGLRYVHHFDQAELEALAASSGFRVCETFLSDGANSRLGLYQIWERA